MADSFQPPLGSREERAAYNESWARDVNSARAEWQSGSMLGFRCECETIGCAQLIDLEPSEWERIRAKPNRFVIAPGHDGPGDMESVVERGDRFWVVEKHGEAGRVAEELA
jgi:hypothetical protein